jgi:hypothetical protein
MNISRRCFCTSEVQLYLLGVRRCTSHMWLYLNGVAVDVEYLVDAMYPIGVDLARAAMPRGCYVPHWCGHTS